MSFHSSLCEAGRHYKQFHFPVIWERAGWTHRWPRCGVAEDFFALGALLEMVRWSSSAVTCLRVRQTHLQSSVISYGSSESQMIRQPFFSLWFWTGTLDMSAVLLICYIFLHARSVTGFILPTTVYVSAFPKPKYCWCSLIWKTLDAKREGNSRRV